MSAENHNSSLSFIDIHEEKTTRNNVADALPIEQALDKKFDLEKLASQLPELKITQYTINDKKEIKKLDTSDVNSNN